MKISIALLILLITGSCSQFVSTGQDDQGSSSTRQAQVCIQLVGQPDWVCTD